jgi:hypothetical protein
MSNGSPHLDRWHKIVFQRDAQDLQAMLAKDVVFHSPYLLQPYTGRQAAAQILIAVGQVLQDFTYHRELVVDYTWALEFSARVGHQAVKGIDLIRLNDAGLIVEFEVFIRPYNGLRLLGVAMAQRLTSAAAG